MDIYSGIITTKTFDINKNIFQVKKTPKIIPKKL